MVRSGAEAFDDSRIHTGVHRGAGDDRLEQFRRDAARAGKRRQQSARGEQLERHQIDVLVGARRVVHLRRGGRELGRVEHHQAEALAAVA
jgi:hypothetical protein